MTSLPYAEGSVFIVPLREGGYARGVVARSNDTGRVLLGYFFGPKFDTIDEASSVEIDPEDALLRIRFGDLALINGEWPVIGKIDQWDPSMWPMPDFVRKDPLGMMKSVLVRYSDTDPMQIEMEYPIEDDSGLAADSMSGCEAVVIKLSKLLE